MLYQQKQGREKKGQKGAKKKDITEGRRGVDSIMNDLPCYLNPIKTF